MLAFIDALWLIGWSFVLSAPLLLLIFTGGTPPATQTQSIERRT